MPTSPVPNGGAPSYTQQRSAEFSTGNAPSGTTRTPTLDPASHASVLTEAAQSPLMPFHAQGVLQPLQRFSNNGLAAGDAGRRFMAEQSEQPMPSFSGTSARSQQNVMALRAMR
jgi:hypothetical protein